MTEDKESVVWALDLAKAYHRPVLDGVQLAVRPGQTVLIRADSGAGKTTLLELMAGFRQPDRGQVLVQGRNFARLSARRIAGLRRKMGFVFQNLRLNPGRSVVYNLLVPLHINGMWGRPARARVDEVCRLVGIEAVGSVPVKDLSRGEQQLVAVARALVADPFVVFADEPTAQVDTRTALRIMGLLRRISARGAAVVVATADMMAAGAFEADAEFELRDGRLVPRWTDDVHVEPVAAVGA